jgi:DnaJ homolog subfamily C member 19
VIRLLVLLVLVVVAGRLILGQWPWAYLRPKSNRQQALFRARKLLGVSHNANRDDIIAAHRRLVALVHPDRGGTSEQVHEAKAARDLLLDELPPDS